MGVLDILSGLKDKVLDAAHFELLRSAYELQDKNIEQLKHNNEALHENNELLKERSACLQRDLERTSSELEGFKRQIQAEVPYEPSGMAREILQAYRNAGNDSLDDTYLERYLGRTRLDVRAALSELVTRRLLRGSVQMVGRPQRFTLTHDGKQCAVNLR